MKSVLELFEGEAERKKTVFSQIWVPFSCGLAGFGIALFLNWTTRRPLMSGVQNHLLYTGVGALLGKTADGYRNEYLAERDAVLRHYISLHPEDFPLPARQKFADVLLPWVPVR